MKFIHTSDWHIGRQLHNQSLLDDQAFVLEQIIALADEHKVDAVIVAGIFMTDRFRLRMRLRC